MTVVVALKDTQGKLWMGSDKNVTLGIRAIPLHTSKIWNKIDDFGNKWMFGFSGNVSLLQVIKHRVPLPDINIAEDPESVLINSWMPELYKSAKEIGGIIRKDQNSAERLDGSIVLGLRGEIYSIVGFSACHFNTQFHTIGSGSETAFGALDALIRHKVPLSAEEMIRSAISSASAYDPNIGGGVDILSESY